MSITVNPQFSAAGAYSKLEFFGAALNRGRRLFEGGAYLKTKLSTFHIFYLSKKINTCPKFYPRLDPGAGLDHNCPQRLTHHSPEMDQNEVPRVWKVGFSTILDPPPRCLD